MNVHPALLFSLFAGALSGWCAAGYYQNRDRIDASQESALSPKQFNNLIEHTQRGIEQLHLEDVDQSLVPLEPGDETIATRITGALLFAPGEAKVDVRIFETFRLPDEIISDFIDASEMLLRDIRSYELKSIRLEVQNQDEILIVPGFSNEEANQFLGRACSNLSSKIESAARLFTAMAFESFPLLQGRNCELAIICSGGSDEHYLVEERYTLKGKNDLVRSIGVPTRTRPQLWESARWSHLASLDFAHLRKK
ncbi:MAG: hypothetical protein KA004_13065 [Verrucomicrobiales bacterium]|nr:hypothetical protein [Verrucomicrobiales bacterium]